MEQRQLGTTGPNVSALGLGCMSFAGFFGATDTATSLRCLDAARDHGITFFDTANVYGAGRSEEVLGQWPGTRRPGTVIATKGGIVRDPARPVNNEPAYLRGELEGSLRRLGVERVDLYYIHRRDASVPIEDLAGFLGGLVAEGKIGGYGLSEVSPATLRRAHAEFPCHAVQSEYSLWTRLPELGMVQACAELGVAFVPFSPLARGVLSEDSPDPGVMAKDDYRLQIPRFSAENYPRNLSAVAGFKTYARDHGWTVSALALAWLLHRGDHIVPIPGTRSAEHLADWAGAPAIRLSAAQMAEIGALLPPGFAHGDRYSDDQMRTVERYC